MFPCVTVKNDGVTLDCHLTIKTHISNRPRLASFELQRVSSIFFPQMSQKSLFLLLLLHALTTAVLFCPAVLIIEDSSGVRAPDS